jgi:putative oxidoreductase
MSLIKGSTAMLLLDRGREPVLSLFRMVVGLLFVCHGASSLFGVLGGAQGSGGTVAVGSWPGWWAALIQLVAGLMVLLGAGTRSASLLGSGSMAYAYFTVHQSMALFPIQNKGEPSVLFCWALLLIAVFGPGEWSIDALIGRRLRHHAESVAPQSETAKAAA